MFEYVKELINEKIEKDMQSFDRQQEKKEDIECSISLLSNYEDLKYELKANKIRLIFSVIGLIISFIIVPFANSTAIYLLGGIIALNSSLKIIEYKNKVSVIENNIISSYRQSLQLIKDELKEAGKLEYYKEKINNKKSYLNRFELTREIIEVVKNILNNKKVIICNDITKLKKSIYENNNILNIIDHNELKEYFNKEFVFTIGESTNKEELINLKKQICNSILDSYLTEKIDCSSIHINNNLDENKKKLIKNI